MVPRDSRGQSRGPQDNRGQSKGPRDNRGPGQAKGPQDRDHPVRAKNRGARSSRSLALLHKDPGSPGPSSKGRARSQGSRPRLGAPRGRESLAGGSVVSVRPPS